MDVCAACSWSGVCLCVFVCVCVLYPMWFFLTKPIGKCFDSEIVCRMKQNEGERRRDCENGQTVEATEVKNRKSEVVKRRKNSCCIIQTNIQRKKKREWQPMRLNKACIIHCQQFRINGNIHSYGISIHALLSLPKYSTPKPHIYVCFPLPFDLNKGLTPVPLPISMLNGIYQLYTEITYILLLHIPDLREIL